MRASLFIATLGLVSVFASAQSCPRENPNGPPTESDIRSLTGRLVYHDEIRKWIGIKLEAPVCGETEIQLLRGGGAFEVDESNSKFLEVFRGCRVTTSGALGIPGTGYYSTDIYQNVDKIEPAPGCVRQPPFLDFSTVKPDSSIRSYRVVMNINYRERGGRITFDISDGHRRLSPWQVYANYGLTGGYVLYGRCADGFKVHTVFGTPQANPSHFDEPDTSDDMAAFDPESAAAKHIFAVKLGYVCKR